MWAILSDIHANLAALQAVLSDAAWCGVDKIVCLGDTVGYGPDPLECIELSMSWEAVLQGNNERGLLFEDELPGYSTGLARSILWHRKLLSQPSATSLRNFLANRPQTQCRQGMCLAHGSPSPPFHQFLFAEDIYNVEKIQRIGSSFSSICFVGHTHCPGIFTENSPGAWGYLAPEECGGECGIENRKAICNVGSVGQPRDGDWRACYVLFDGESVAFRRVEYDVEATIARINACSELDNFLGERLREGR